MSYILGQIEHVEAIALENKSELDLRTAVYKDFPIIKEKIESIDRNVIKLCTLQGFDC